MTMIPSLDQLSRLSDIEFAHKISHRRFEKIKFMLRGFLYRKSLFALVNHLTAIDYQLMVENRLLSKVMRPYLFSHGDTDFTSSILSDHYRFLQDKSPSLYQHVYHGQGMTMGATDDGEFQIRLLADSQFRREGELCLSLYQGELRLYSCAFTIGHVPFSDDKSVKLWVGALQGPSHDIEDASERIKQATKAAFGLRPRDLLMQVVFMLAEHLDITQVLAVKTASHVYQARRYSKKQKNQVCQNYDAIWEEYQATFFNHDFSALSLPARKSMEEISSNKRSSYRKRYLWLDGLKESVQQLDHEDDAVAPLPVKYAC